MAEPKETNKPVVFPALVIGGYHAKRGKIVPELASSWGMRSGDNAPFNPDEARRVLDEALGD